MAVIQSGNPKSAPGKTGTWAQYMSNILVGKGKCRGLSLCTVWCIGDVQCLPVDCFNLFRFGRKLKGNLNGFRFRMAQA